MDYTDVQLKIIQNEGYEAHDFNIFDDRAALLWRKPYVDGAVRELTSGEDRSPEELRRAVEQLMISAGDRNADVRASIHAGHTDQSNIRINANIDQTDELLKRIRRDLVSPSWRTQNTPARTRGRAPAHSRFRLPILGGTWPGWTALNGDHFPALYSAETAGSRWFKKSRRKGWGYMFRTLVLIVIYHFLLNCSALADK